MKLYDIRKSLIEALQPNFSEREARYLVDLLLEFVLEENKTSLLAQNPSVEKKHYDLLNSYTTRLKNDEPIQYILEEEFFFGLPFKVNKEVLIPRPETEELVEWILESVNPNDAAKILDIGTGSGCIAISLKAHLSNSSISAVDISNTALEVAKYNASANALEIDFIQLDILDEQSWAKFKNFDVIVSNPPYIPLKEKSLMHRNVLDFEPSTALFVEDNNALVFYEKITQLALQKLTTSGILFFECNEYNALDVEKLLNQFFTNVELKKDINGKYRMTKAYSKK